MASTILLVLSLVLTFYVTKFTLHWVLLLLRIRHRSVIIFSLAYILILYSLIAIAIYIPPQPKKFLVDTYRLINELTTVASIRINEALTNLPTLDQTLLITPSVVSETFCSANPGPKFTSVYLRVRPSWSKQATREIVPRGTMLKIYGKIVNEARLWFEVQAEDGSKRYIDAEICKTEVDRSAIPDIPADSILPPLSR